MIDFQINRFPVIILANFRTGSSPLAIHLARKYNLECYSEPFHNENIAKYDEHKMKFIHRCMNSTNTNYIVKFMPSQISDLNNYDLLMNGDGFKIRLNRKNKFDQIVSLYIAEKRNKYFKLKNENQIKYYLEIDKKALIESTNSILRNDFLLERLPYKYNMDLSYEDLGFIENTDHVLSDLPDNIEELQQEVRKILFWRWNQLKTSIHNILEP